MDNLNKAYSPGDIDLIFLESHLRSCGYNITRTFTVVNDYNTVFLVIEIENEDFTFNLSDYSKITYSTIVNAFKDYFNNILK